MIPQSTLYNQTILNDDDFVASFVARRDALETMCRRLKSVGLEGDGQHQILIGTRGMGKTSMLRRMAIEIKENHELSNRFVPLMFREEQYNVLRLQDFWRNCGESLAGWAESQGHDDLAEHLDDVVFSSSWDSDDDAAEQFEAEMLGLGKRAVLLIDNLDLILDGLKEEDRWTLRASLQARGGPILVGAATQSLKETADREAAFYEFFQPYYLEPLQLQEAETCMRALASQRGEVGRRVLHVMHTDPARLRVLHRLTGGNPRILALTYRLLETEDSHSAMADLERLLDEVTPYYKARVEEYQTPLQRAIIDAIALHWDPVTTGQLSDITGIPTTTLSPQLTRLRKDGLIEKTETSGSYAGHQVVERFLNIWYLMRHGTRRTRQRMRWLVAFLSSFYCKDELEEIGRAARATGRFDLWTREYAHAFEQATQIAPARERLGLKSAWHHHDDMFEAGYPNSLEAKKAKELGDKGVSMARDGEGVAALEVFEEVIARYSDNPDLQVKTQVVRAILNKGITLARTGNVARALEVYDDLIVRYGDSDALSLRELVARAMLGKGMALGRAGEQAAEIAIYDDLIARYGDSDALLLLQEQVARAMFNKGITLGRTGDPAAKLEVYDDLIARFGDSDALLQVPVGRAMLAKGNMLVERGNLAGALEVYDDLIVRYGDSEELPLRELVARAMHSKGITLGQIGDFTAEIEAYDALVAGYRDSEALALQEQVARAMLSKGITLGQIRDYTAEVEVYDDVIARYSDGDALPLQELVARAMLIKGNRLGLSGDYMAEIEAYDRLIAGFEGSDALVLQEQVGRAKLGKGNSLGQIGDYTAEIAIYSDLIDRYGDSDALSLQDLVARTMLSKGMILAETGDPAGAIEIYSDLMARYGDSDAPSLQELVARTMLSKGEILAETGDPAEAIEIYSDLMARYGGSDALSLQELVAGAMLRKGATLGQTGDYTAEVEVYDDVIARHGDSDAFPLQEQVALAMLNKGNVLSQTGDPVAGIAIYDALVARYGSSDALTLQEQVARALLSKGIALGETGDPAAELENYEDVIARYGDSDALPLQEQVALAMLRKGGMLSRTDDPAVEIGVYDGLIARFEDSDSHVLQEKVVRAKFLLANRLIDAGTEGARAEALLKSLVESRKVLAYGNLFWLYVTSRELSKAREALTHLKDVPVEGRALMDAALAVLVGNFGDATEYLNKALQGGLVLEDWNFTDDLERLLRLSITAGLGESLVDWFEETRLANRYGAVHAALKAAVHGEASLLDVNPETSHAAGLILSRLLPASKPRKGR